MVAFVLLSTNIEMSNIGHYRLLTITPLVMRPIFSYICIPRTWASFWVVHQHFCLCVFRLNFSTAWSTNAVSICQSAGLANVTRVEQSRRFLIKVADDDMGMSRFDFVPIYFSEVTRPSPHQAENGRSTSELGADIKELIGCLHDSMTECVYQHPITSFAVETTPQPVFEVDILGKGRAALETANRELGEAFWKCCSAFTSTHTHTESLVFITWCDLSLSYSLSLISFFMPSFQSCSCP